MKKILTILTLFALAISLQAQTGSGRNFLPKGETVLPSGSTLTIKGILQVAAGGHSPSILRRFSLGTPILSAVDTLVADAAMKTTAYTLVGAVNGVTTLDVPRVVTITKTTAGSKDVACDVVVVGTDYAGNALTETINTGSGSGATIVGTKAFKTVSSVRSADWVINATSTSTADRITVGVGNLIGLPVALSTATGTALTTLGTTVAVSNTTGSTGSSLPLSTVDASGGTYDGSKKLYVYLEY